jgi:hypothetical protein
MAKMVRKGNRKIMAKASNKNQSTPQAIAKDQKKGKTNPMKNLRKENTTHKCPRVVNANELVDVTRKLLHEPKS